MLFSPASKAQEKQENSIQWNIAGELPVMNGEQKSLGFAGSVTGIINDLLLIAGGSNFPADMPWHGGKKKYYDDIYLFKRAQDGLAYINSSFKLPAAIAYAASCTTPFGTVYAGGENENGASNKVWLLQYDTNTAAITHKALPDLPISLTNACVAYYGNALYLAGGENSEGVTDKFYQLELGSSKRWIDLSPVPHAVSHSVLVAQSDGKAVCIYLVGGRKKSSNGISDLYDDVFAFDLSSNKWTKRKSLPYSLSAHSGVSIGSHSIMIFGGDKGTTFHRSETLTAAINKEEDQIKKKQLLEEKVKLQSTHPGFTKNVLVYNTIKNKWEQQNEIPFIVPVTTKAVLWESDVIIPGGEIKAGIRTPVILMGKIPGK